MEQDLSIRSKENRERTENEESESSSTGEDTEVDEASVVEPVVDEAVVKIAATSDLRIRLTGPKQVFMALLVCSKTLASASSVFKGMLYGASGQPLGNGANWVVTLPRDSFTAMAILLNIAHGQHEKVPSALLIAELSMVVAASHKYDMTALLKRWAKTWLRSPEVLMSGGELRLLHIGWELGDLQLYKKTTMTIIMNCCVNNGRLSYPRDRSEVAAGGKGTPDSVWDYEHCDSVNCGCLSHVQHLRPADLRERIQRCRDTIISAKLKPLYMFYELFQKGICRSEDFDVRYRCMALAYGSLAMSVEKLRKEGISIALAEPVVPKSYSVAMLGRLIADFKVEALCGGCAAEIEGIWEAGGQNEREVISKLDLLSRSDLEHMAVQAKKTDVSTGTWPELEGGRGG